MKTFLLYTISLFFGLNFFGQNDFEKATFKNGDVKKIISEKFYALNGNNSTGEEIVIISFDLTKKGMLLNVKPEKFKNKRNVVSILLAIQTTDGMWNPTRIDGELKTQSYKMVFTFFNSEIHYKYNRNKYDKLMNKKKYKKTLEFLNKAIEKEPYKANLYLNRANVKSFLKDVVGEKEDLTIYIRLKREILTSLTLGVFSKERRTLMYQTRTVRN